MTYVQMVNVLFKPDTEINMLLHAAIGLVGETGELRAARSHEHALEECGDLLFYAEALRQRLPLVPEFYGFTKDAMRPVGHATAMDNMHIYACEILSVVKKHWVYNRQLDIPQLSMWLETFEISLHYYIEEMCGMSVESVQEANKNKLLGKRYSTGSYSDEQANARADKNEMD